MPPAEPSTALPAQAEVVIVGGGIIGVSTAYHLAEAGVKNIVVVESAEALGTGSSGKPIGGVRAQFSDPTNIQLGLRSLEAYKRFGTRPGVDIGLRQVGYLFLLSDEADIAPFETSMALQNEYGVPSRFVTPAEVNELCPYVPAGSVVAGTFCPIDGYARPWAIIDGLVRGARELGVRFVLGTAVTGISTEAGRISAVHTDAGDIRTRSVVCAAGAWSTRIGAMVGVELPITPLRRQLAFTREDALPPVHDIPFTLDFTTSAYFHNADGNSLLFGYSDPAQEPGFDRSWTPEWLELFRGFARLRAPELAEAEVEKGWAGLYEMTPDANALIGSSGAVEGFSYACGFSGHGLLQAPAVGEVMRDLVLGRTPFVDISRFDAQRFAPGGAQLAAEVAVI